MTAASAADTGNHKKIIRSGTIILVTLNKEIDNIMKIVKYFENSGLFIKGVTQTIENKTKEQMSEFLGMLWGALGSS